MWCAVVQTPRVFRRSLPTLERSIQTRFYIKKVGSVRYSPALYHEARIVKFAESNIFERSFEVEFDRPVEGINPKHGCFFNFSYGDKAPLECAGFFPTSTSVVFTLS
jgi:hypothetical protein